jgi:hypothetical protein
MYYLGSTRKVDDPRGFHGHTSFFIPGTPVSIFAASKIIKLIPNRQYDDEISGHRNWLQSIIGIPNLTSDVLLVLDYYVEAFSRGVVEEPITHLSDDDYGWARYGIIAAGYTQNSASPGGLLDCFTSTLEDLAHSGQLVNCAFVIKKLREGRHAFEDGMELVVIVNGGSGSIILAPIQA